MRIHPRPFARNTLGALFVTLVVGLISACGSDSDPEPTAPATTPTVAVGTITGFGSVIVNGVRYLDGAAEVSIDDQPGQRSQLRVGMVVQVEGSVNACPNADTALCEGVATRIRFRNNLVGPITTLNQLQNTITVMGRTIEVDDSTSLDGVPGNTLDGLALGDVVAVSGLEERTRNRLRARWLERQGAFVEGTTRLQLEGDVSAVDAGRLRFLIGTQEVAYAGACINAPQGKGPKNGQHVVVEGRSLAGGVLTCERLRLRERTSFPDASLFEVEGYVSNFTSPASFEIDGQKVDASAPGTVFRNGTAADLANGVKLEVEGTVTAGVLVASKVTFRLEALAQTQLQFEAPLQVVDAAAGRITVLGQVVEVDPLTQFKDQSSTSLRTFSLADLKVGDRLDVRAYAATSGALVASRIERTDADERLVVKGPLEALTAPTGLTIVGVGVSTGAATRYRDADGVLIPQADFFALLQVPPAQPTRLRAQGVAGSDNRIDATRTASKTGEVAVAN